MVLVAAVRPVSTSGTGRPRTGPNTATTILRVSGALWHSGPGYADETTERRKFTETHLQGFDGGEFKAMWAVLKKKSGCFFLLPRRGNSQRCEFIQMKTPPVS